MKRQTRTKRREEYAVRIGPKLKQLIEEQMVKIRGVTYDVVKNSAWEAGEIIAMKFKGEV